MKSSKLVLLLSALAILLFCTGCPEALVQSPKFEGSSIEVATCPTNFTVSNGLKGTINFSWDAFKGAKKYYIYSSDDGYSGFTKCYETSDTSFSFTNMPAGIDKYYYVAAVTGSNNALSKPSDVKRGTTLAAPVLNAILEGDDPVNDAKVYWYMNNVEAYADDVEYKVYYYANATGGTPIGSATSSGDVTYVTFTGLGSYKSYYYYVEAHNVNEDESVVENSGARLNYITAAETNPQPVEVTKYTKGDNGRNISIKFKLPEMVRVAQEGNALYPLKFQISRKLEGSNEPWYVVDTFVGETNETTGKLGFYEQIEQGENDSNYISGSEIVWTDTYADGLGRYVETGKNYYYQIKSYADYKTTITSNGSITYVNYEDNPDTAAKLFVAPTVTISEPQPTVSGSTNTLYTATFTFENTKNGNLDLTSGFDMYVGKKCTSVDGNSTVTYTYDKFEQTDCSKTWTQNGSWTLPKTFNLEGDNAVSEGNYKFYIFIINSGSLTVADGTSFDDLENTTGVLAAIPVSGTYLFYKDRAKIPTIDNFSVTKGYPGTITIKFDAAQGITYKVSYEVNGVETDVRIKEGEDRSTTTTNFSCAKDFSTGTELASSINEVSIVHTIDNFTANYSVTATNSAGVSLTKTDEGYTLYSPNFTFTPSYDSVKIDFVASKGATSYTLSGTLPDGTTSINADVTDTNGDGTYSYTITGDEALKVADMANAGKKFDLTLTATGDNGSKATTKKVNILGPAEISLQAQNAKQNSIGLTWNVVNGASGYVVYRVMYKTTELLNSYTTSGDYVGDTSKFFVKVTNGVCEVQNSEGGDVDNITCNYSESSEGDSIIWEDKVYTGSDFSTNQVQGKIAWGYPYGYIVFPVKTFEDVEIDYDSGNLEMNDKKAIYYNNFAEIYPSFGTSKVSAIASTYGYGLNLRASKAESAETIRLEWDAPYNKTDNTHTYIFYRPQYVHDHFGDVQENESKDWTLLASVAGVTDCDYEVPYTKLLSCLDLPVEFMVKFGKGANVNSAIVDSFANDASAGGLKTLEDTSESGRRYVYSNASDAEQRNVGYLCTLPKFNADFAGNPSTASGDDNYFKETVTWETWNTTYRKLVPESYSILVKNKNVANTCDWSKVLMTVTGNSSAAAGLTQDVANSSVGNVILSKTVTSVDGSLSIKPATLSYTRDTMTGSEYTINGMDGYFDGYLKVQRDYKHYYGVKFNLTHIVDNASATTTQKYKTAISGDTFDIGDAYGYRNVTVEESLKNELLILGDALTQTGWAESSQHTCSDTVGTFATFAYSGSGAVEWGTFDSDYRHSFQSGASSGDTSKLVSGYVIKFPKTKYEDGHVGNGIGYYAETPITVVSHDSGLSSYVNSFAIKAGKKRSTIWSLGEEYHLWVNFGTYIDGTEANNSIHIKNNQTAFQSWLPYWLGHNGDRYSTYASGVPVYSTELGWWN